jgi:SAM-dependent methyltransferase
MGSQDWVTADVDTERPSAARIYDYWLGGAHNFEADRRVAEQMLAAYPDGRQKVWANRAFLRRAVEFLVGEGVRQFLDVGSGVPTVGHVHEVAQALAPESRVVFVDIDPVAVAHSRVLLAANDRTAAIQEDVRRPEQIWAAPEVQGLLDLSKPVAVLAVALFHFIPDADDPAGVIARLTAPLASGSYLALSHGTEDGVDDTTELEELYRRVGINWSSRPHHQVEAFFAGHDLVEPGLVWVQSWRSDSIDDPYRDHPEYSSVYAGVGRKR